MTQLNHDTSAASRSPEELRELALSMYMNTAQGLKSEAELSRRSSTRVTGTLLSIAVLRTVSLIFLAMALSIRVEAPTRNLILMSEVICTAVLWALAVWSVRSPLGAAVTSLAVYVTFWMAQSTLEYQWAVVRFGKDDAFRHMGYLGWGTLVRWSILLLLVQCIFAGIRHRKLNLAASTADDSGLLPLATTPNRKAGVVSALMLYMVYLYLPLNLSTLAIEGDLTDSLLLRHLVGWGIIVGAWSIAPWRDVYRPLIQFVHPGWYLGAIVAGGCTYLFATISLELFSKTLGLPNADPTDYWTTLGYGWAFALLVSALHPAVFEEIAFRGVIYSGLSRWLGPRETILATSLMFMAIHMNPIAFPHLFVCGVAFGVMRWKSNSWLPGVLMHFTHNGLCVVMPMMGLG